MNLSDTIITIAQAQEVVQPNLFPFPLPFHLAFSCISLVFFLFQFKREKKPYQLIMAFAIPFSLLLWLFDSHTLFYAVGITELICFAAAFITSIIFKDKNPEKTESEAETEADEADGNDEKNIEDENDVPKASEETNDGE